MQIAYAWAVHRSRVIDPFSTVTDQVVSDVGALLVTNGGSRFVLGVELIWNPPPTTTLPVGHVAVTTRLTGLPGTDSTPSTR